MDADARVLEWNLAAEKLFGYTREEALGRSILDLIGTPSVNEHVQDVISRVLAGDTHAHSINENRTKDDRILICEWFNTPLLGEDGKLAGLISLAGDVTERERTKDELARHALLLASVRDSVIVTDLEGIVTYWNEGAMRLFGWTADEMVGRPLTERVPEPGREPIAAAIRACREGEEFSGEWEDYRKDGSRVWIDARVTRITDVTGKAIGLMGLAYDISDRKRAEQALRDSEEQVRLLLDSTAEAIYGVDLNGRCTFCNAAFLRLMGYADIHELLGKDMHRLIQHTRVDGTHYPREECRIFRTFHQGEEARVEDEVLWRADGTSFPVEYWTYPMRRRGEVVGAVVTFVDITERRRVEAELGQKREILQTIFDHIPVMVHFGDSTGRVKLVNRHWEDVLGWSFEDMKKIYIFAACYPDPVYREHVLECARLASPGWHDFRTRVRDGRIIDTCWTGVVLSDGTAIWFGEDITDRKQSQKALSRYAERLQVLSRRVVEVQEEERRHLARELHDEIGQVLTAIGINLQVLKRSCGPEAQPRLDDCIGVVNRAVEQVRGLALDLRPSMLDDFGLDAALRWLVDRQAQRAGLVGHFTVQPSVAPLPPDLATACYRVAQEALTNVVRHARARHVWVELQQGEAEVRLTIRDDGVGFDPEESRRRAARGASAGLLGIRERAEVLGGRVSIEPELGRGVSIRFWLPLRSTLSSG